MEMNVLEDSLENELERELSLGIDDNLTGLMDDLVLIVGSSSEIGAAVVSQFLNNGYHIIGLDLFPSDEIHAHYTHFTVDISNEKELRKVFTTVSEYGFIKHVIVIDNNGITENLEENDLTTIDKKEFKNFVQSFISEAFSIAKVSLPYLRSTHGISSLTFTVDVNSLERGDFCYSVAQAATIQMVKHLARSEKPRNVHVNALSFNTSNFEDATAIAEDYYYLVTKMISVTGQILALDDK